MSCFVTCDAGCTALLQNEGVDYQSSGGSHNRQEAEVDSAIERESMVEVICCYQPESRT